MKYFFIIQCALLAIAPAMDFKHEYTAQDYIMCYGVSALFAIAAALCQIADKLKPKP